MYEGTEAGQRSGAGAQETAAVVLASTPAEPGRQAPDADPDAETTTATAVTVTVTAAAAAATATATAEALRRQSAALRRPPVTSLGAIDVGTNSIHLVMAEISPDGDFRILGRDKEMVLLGQGGFVQHVLTTRAMNDGLATLKRFMKMARLKGITRLNAVATSAVREARNGGVFVSRVRDQLGLDLQVVSAEEEARLIYLAVRHAIDLGEGDNLIADIGGGSLEVIVGNAQRAEVLASLKLGASRLAELFIHSDPPAPDELRALRHHVEQSLEPLADRIGPRRFDHAVATSGTVQNLATICAYRRGLREIEPVTQLRIERGEIKALLSDLSEMPRAERSRIPGIDARRVDSLLPATVLLNSLMRAFGISEFEYCDMAVREGMILDHIARHRAGLRARATWPDPRTRSALYLGERCGYRREHAEQVSRLALSLFDQLAGLHGLGARDRDLLKYGCLLHDVGDLISHKAHHKHSYYLIRNGGLQGFSEPEIEVIANLARYHRKGRPKKSHYSYQNLDEADRPAVRRMIPLLRLANALDRTHYSVVDRVECRVMKDRVELLVHTGKDAELELWTAGQHRGLFAKEFGMPIAIEISPAPANDREPGEGGRS
jgi:exopolyphosphatase/guanosine-5'-triphosphate,3'-diphosphate pyrophosphatase